MHVCPCARFIVHRCIDTTASIGSGANSHSVAPRVAMRGGRNGVAVFHGEHLADRHFAPISSEEKENKQKQTKRKKKTNESRFFTSRGGGNPWKPLLTTRPPTSTSLSPLCGSLFSPLRGSLFSPPLPPRRHLFHFCVC